MNKKFHIEKKHRILMAFIIGLLPFGGSIGIFPNFFTRMTEGSTYPIIVALIFWGYELIINNKKIQIPCNRTTKMAMALICVCVFCFIFNANDIVMNEYQGKSGFSRGISVSLSYAFLIATILYVYNVFALHGLETLDLIYKFCIFSLIIPLLYTSVELNALFFQNSQAIELLHSIDGLFRDTSLPVYDMFRLRSVAHEPSSLGYYTCFIFPWLLLRTYTTKGYKHLFFLFILVYVSVVQILTFSRTVYAIQVVEIIFFFLFNRNLINKRILFELITIIPFMFIALESVDLVVNISIAEVFSSLTSDTNISNIARYGSTIAAYNMFLDNPFLGVGIGQFGFYAQYYYPAWSWSSLEIMNWGNSAGNIWPPVFNVFLQFFCENGILGGVLFVAIQVDLLYKSIRETLSIQDVNLYRLNSCVCISVISCIALGFSTQEIFWGYAILIGLMMKNGVVK